MSYLRPLFLASSFVPLALVAASSPQCFAKGQGQFAKDEATAALNNVCDELLYGGLAPKPSVDLQKTQSTCRTFPDYPGKAYQFTIEPLMAAEHKKLTHDDCATLLSDILDECARGGWDRTDHGEFELRADPQGTQC
ncbi:uncharacterized protein BDZ99DRAFT_575512 [Mytilinidion resinicola]|uniref:Secreted protein n=1 Tax=Mytilinidion resinicola TaxID=574789 RepID=A0A6A6Y6G8_9PEZI|nr:uncharacterized protein BDZ99DRAFT_575512 [Mytilinidion resinicola]KAF2804280.1 hypothetical protein BDZ99DRAFT_575512 [Mytilinidion resinicola]